jgi:penicillin-binding protein 1C
VGSKSAAPLLIDILNSISAAHVKTILPRPKDIRARQVCARSGLTPGARCTHFIEDVFAVARTSARSCDICRDLLVSPDGRLAFCSSCIGDKPFGTRGFEEYPSALIDFWRKNGVACTLPPPHNPLCTRLFGGDGPAIVSPSADMIYYCAAADRKLVLQAASGSDVGHHAWYVNDTYLGKNRAGRKLFVAFADGPHTVTCVDDRGRATSVRITVKTIL